MAHDILKMAEQNDFASPSIVESVEYKAIDKLGFSSLKPQQMIAISAFLDSYMRRVVSSFHFQCKTTFRQLPHMFLFSSSLRYRRYYVVRKNHYNFNYVIKIIAFHWHKSYLWLLQDQEHSCQYNCINKRPTKVILVFSLVACTW